MAAILDRDRFPAPNRVPCSLCGTTPRNGAVYCDGCGTALTPAGGGPVDVALPGVARAVMGTLELEPMLRDVARACLGATGAESCTIERWFPASDELVVLAADAVADWPLVTAPGTRTALAERPSARVALAGRVVRYGAGDPGFADQAGATNAGRRVQALVDVPIFVRGRCVGLLELLGRDERAFSPDKVAAVVELAAYAGLGIERGEAFARERKLAARLQTVARAATDAAQELDPDRLLDELPELIRDAFGSYLVNVFLVDETDGGLLVRANAGYPGPSPVGLRMPPGTGVCGRVAATGEPYLVADVLADPHYLQGPDLFGTRAELAAPIRVGDRVVGVLDVQSETPGAFDAEDAVALQALASAVGVAMNNARLFRRVQSEEARLRAILDAVPSPLTVYDGSWRVELANRALLELYESPRRDLTGTTFAEMAGAAVDRLVDPPAFLDHRDGSQAATPDAELRFADPPATFVRRVTALDVGGQPSGHVVLYQDVTAERAALRAKDEILSIAAHELRTPLTALLGFLDLLGVQMSRPDPDLAKIGARIAIAGGEARRLATLVEELLDLARLETGPAPLHLHEVEVSGFLMRVADRFATVDGGTDRIRLAPSGPGRETLRAVWDEGRVDQILTNLIDNALKYSPAPEPVRISAEIVGDEVRIEITDSGPGLSVEELAGLFKPFARAPGAARSSRGLGLGLHVSRRLAERHGGSLWLDSVPGTGTTAVLMLPRDAAEG